MTIVTGFRPAGLRRPASLGRLEKRGEGARRRRRTGGKSAGWRRARTSSPSRKSDAGASCATSGSSEAALVEIGEADAAERLDQGHGRAQMPASAVRTCSGRMPIVTGRRGRAALAIDGAHGPRRRCAAGRVRPGAGRADDLARQEVHPRRADEAGDEQGRGRARRALSGVPNWTTWPRSMIAIRSARVIASTWSWVT